MPRIEYKSNDKVISRAMPTPKKVASMEHWLKQARKIIPEIPKREPYNSWCSLKVVVFEFATESDTYVVTIHR